MTRFDTDTGLRVTGDGTLEGRIDPAWSIVRGANGGHIAAIVLRGMAMTLDDRQRFPRTHTVHFLRVPANDAFQIRASVERSGRSLSTVTARMVQGDKLIALGLAAFATPQTGPEFSEITMPEVPPPEDLEPVPDRADFPFGAHFDFRPALGPVMVAPSVPVRELSERAELALWVRMREPQDLDPFVVTQLCDAFAPAVFAKLGAGGGGAGVPTIEMTYHYRDMLPLTAAKPDDWYLGVFRTSTARGGFIEEDGWLWSRRGKLVAQSRQLAILTGA
jgi:acyl-CoA thioesterase